MYEPPPKETGLPISTYTRMTANSLTQQINTRSITFAWRSPPRALHAFISEPDPHTSQPGRQPFRQSACTGGHAGDS